MVLAEALLRVPDADTADRLIEDKLAAGDWSQPERSRHFLVSASAWTLGVTARLIQPGETPENILESLAKRLGLPAVRAATRQAMRLLGSHFVLGQTIEEALVARRLAPRVPLFVRHAGRGRAHRGRCRRAISTPMRDAIDAIGARAGNARAAGRGPAFRSSSRRCIRATRRCRASACWPSWCRACWSSRAGQAPRPQFHHRRRGGRPARIVARRDRRGAGRSVAAGWDGFGLAVQAYQKRAPAVIDWLADTAHGARPPADGAAGQGRLLGHRGQARAGARAADYPVFTRKAMTDLCYMACARQLLAARPRIYPQFATHNALTVASVIEDAGGVEGYEFQRLHGMGEVLYEALLADDAGRRLPRLCAGRRPSRSARLSGAAAAGERRQLLVRVGRRRSERADRGDPASARRPGSATPTHARHPKIPLPRDLYRPARVNSPGVEFGDRAALAALLAEVARAAQPRRAGRAAGRRRRRRRARSGR